jgi:hypothetical protein
VRPVLVPRAHDVARPQQLGGPAAGEDDLAAQHAGEHEQADEQRERQLLGRRPQPGLERDRRDDQRPARHRLLLGGHAGHQVGVGVEQRDRLPAR